MVAWDQDPQLETLFLNQPEHAGPGRRRSGGFPWLIVLGFAYLAFYSVVAIYCSKGNMAEVDFFVAFSYADHVHVGIVWALRTLLALLFSYKIAAMPVLVQILVRGMAGAAILCVFYDFFIPKDEVAATFWNYGSVLGALRRHWPQGAEVSRAQDPRDVAWSVIRLILDSGASRHAVGNMWLLEGFQSYTPPLSARLADGRNVRVLGIGRIDKPGNFIIPDVDLVEGVQDGLISIPQLDREHGLVACFGNGICRIMHADGTEVGGALLEDDGMYVLRYLEVPAGPSQEL